MSAETGASRLRLLSQALVAGHAAKSQAPRWSGAPSH
jgi:hypothetical protein